VQIVAEIHSRTNCLLPFNITFSVLTHCLLSNGGFTFSGDLYLLLLLLLLLL
jgi:hypothetical protein